MGLKGIGCKTAECIYLSENRDQCRLLCTRGRASAFRDLQRLLNLLSKCYAVKIDSASWVRQLQFSLFLLLRKYQIMRRNYVFNLILYSLQERHLSENRFHTYTVIYKNFLL